MKKMKNSGLGRARSLFRKRRFSETIRILEPQVFTYRENPYFYYMLGMSCLLTNDSAGAYSYLKRAVQLNKDFVDARLALAVVHLKRMETEESIRIWLEVLDDHPNNKIAKKGLDLLKMNASPERIPEFVESSKLKSIIPSTGFYLPFSLLVSSIAIVLIAVIAITGILIKRGMDIEKASKRPEISAVTIEKDAPIVDEGEKAAFMLSAPEIREAFQNIKRLLEEYKDNQARKEINRILLSNASRQVKDRVRIFIPHIKAPNFITMNDTFTFQDVSRNVALYEGCFVRWKGRVTNLKTTEKEITFDFLSGYHDQKVLEGIIPAKLEFPVKIDPAFAYEIIAQIVPAAKNEKGFSLKIASIHEMGL